MVYNTVLYLFKKWDGCEKKYKTKDAGQNKNACKHVLMVCFFIYCLLSFS